MLVCTFWCLFARGEDEWRMAVAIVDIMVVIFSIILNYNERKELTCWCLFSRSGANSRNEDAVANVNTTVVIFPITFAIMPFILQSYKT